MNFRRRPHFGLPAILLLLCLAPCASPAAQTVQLYQQGTAKDIQDALDDLEFAITERNFRITGRLSIGKAIRERDGAGFPDYEVILFCNLSFARDMLALEPEYVVYCPGKVAVRGKESNLVISTPLLPEDSGRPELDALAARINVLLREIVDFGARPWSDAERQRMHTGEEK